MAGHILVVHIWQKQLIASICECVYVYIHVCCVFLVLDILLCMYIVVLGAGIPLEQGVQLYLRVLCNL